MRLDSEATKGLVEDRTHGRAKLCLSSLAAHVLRGQHRIGIARNYKIIPVKNDFDGVRGEHAWVPAEGPWAHSAQEVRRPGGMRGPHVQGS